MSDPIQEFARLVGELNPIHKAFLAGAISNLQNADRAEVFQYFDYCAKHGFDLAYLAEAYNLIVSDMQVQQVFFRRHRRYRHSRFSEVDDAVYFDPDYM